MIKFNILALIVLGFFLTTKTTAQHNYDLVVQGDITIEANAELFIWGDLHIGSAAGDLKNEGLIEIEGNLYKDNLGRYRSNSTGHVIFRNDDVNTADAQFIQGEFTLGDAFRKLEIDNRAPNPLFYLNNGDTEVMNELVLTRGAVSTQTPDGLHPNTISDNRLVVSNPLPGSILGDYNNSWIAGPWNRAIQSNSTFVFPIGSADLTSYGPQNVEMTFKNGPSTTLELNFVEGGITPIGTKAICDVGTPPNNLGVPDGQMDTMTIDCVAGYWDIRALGNHPDYDITLYPSTNLLANCGAELMYLGFEGALLEDCPTSSFTANDLSSFGRFDIPSVVYPENFFLSIELSYFNAIAERDHVMLEWQTLTETDNAGFEVERSTDGQNYTSIAWVEGARNSVDPINYSYLDFAVDKNITYYYRLRVIELDGSREESEVRTAILEEIIEYSETAVYPNPLNPDIDVLNYEALAEGRLDIDIVDETGITVLEEIIEVRQGPNQMNLSNLGDGVYYIIFTDDQYTRRATLVIQR